MGKGRNRGTRNDSVTQAVDTYLKSARGIAGVLKGLAGQDGRMQEAIDAELARCEGVPVSWEFQQNGDDWRIKYIISEGVRLMTRTAGFLCVISRSQGHGTAGAKRLKKEVLKYLKALYGRITMKPVPVLYEEFDEEYQEASDNIINEAAGLAGASGDELARLLKNLSALIDAA